ncbi:MAG: LysR family transcriptional regulator [Lachnospiraceae bacterium]|nr:LysR family transcriptional regulator [Lachnospiraceae bacterium]
MDIRTMEYYLAVVREGTISAAAEALHVAQPSLSRQMKELETELDTALFIRGNRKITLTEEGMILRKRAEEMVRLMQMTEEEISQVKNNVTGTVRIGAGESHAFHFLSKAAGEISDDYPDIKFHVTSGDTEDLMDELNNGLIDFAVIFTDADQTLYQVAELPHSDIYGVLLRKDDPLAAKDALSIKDIKKRKIIISRASSPYITGTKEFVGLNIIATYNLIFNASLMVEDGVGIALCFDKLINTTGESPLTFRPLTPEFKSTGKLIWKKYQVFPPAVQMFIDRINGMIH